MNLATAYNILALHNQPKTPPPTPMTDSKTNPLADFLNTFTPMEVSDSMETQAGSYDYPATERHKSGPVSEVYKKRTPTLRAIVVGLLSIGFIILVLSAAIKGGGGCPKLKYDYRPYWKYNHSVFNYTEDSVCHSSRALIDRDHKPVAVNLPGREHCETIYYLGHSDYVYVCRYDGDFSVVFATVTNNETYESDEVALSWRQFCSLMFMSDRLLYDLTHVMFTI
jgi:hypothetical protein